MQDLRGARTQTLIPGDNLPRPSRKIRQQLKGNLDLQPREMQEREENLFDADMLVFLDESGFVSWHATDLHVQSYRVKIYFSFWTCWSPAKEIPQILRINYFNDIAGFCPPIGQFDAKEIVASTSASVNVEDFFCTTFSLLRKFVSYLAQCAKCSEFLCHLLFPFSNTSHWA